jgi:hypothetical protein
MNTLIKRILVANAILAMTVSISMLAFAAPGPLQSVGRARQA